MFDAGVCHFLDGVLGQAYMSSTGNICTQVVCVAPRDVAVPSMGNIGVQQKHIAMCLAFMSGVMPACGPQTMSYAFVLQVVPSI